MKSIVFVIESLNLGGAEKSLVTLLKNLDYSKYKVDLITFKKDGFFKDEVPKEVSQIVIPFPVLSFWDRLKYKMKRKTNKNYHNAQIFWPFVSKYLKNFNKSYDIAIAYNQGFSTYYTSRYIQSEIKYAWININYKKAGYNISLDKIYYNKFDEIVMVSSEVQTGFIEECSKHHFDFKTRIIKDISDKIEISKNADKKPQKKLKGKIKILTVGRLAEQKGLTLAIQACKILNDKKYNLNWYVLGEGAQRDELEKLIKENNLENHFYLLGADPNPYPYMKNCDIYVQTSLFEGLGLTVIEAALLCKPIVSTNFPTVYGIIEDEKTGLIAEMNAVDIAGKIERIIQDVELKKRLIENLSRRENNDKTESLEKINSLFNTPSH